MSLRAVRSAPTFRRFPRVSGDEPLGNTLWSAGKRFSPRERG